MTDYAEIRGTPEDPWYAVRAYARGEQAGIARAVAEDHVAARAMADCLDACRAARLGVEQIHELLELAESDARIEARALDVVQRRALAALRVRRLVLRRLVECLMGEDVAA